MAQFYRRFVRILEKWPADEGRISKDLGTHLREQGRLAFDKTGDFRGNQQLCEQRLASLERIARNHWASQYPRTQQSSAFGLPAEKCQVILSKEFVQEYEQEMNKSYFVRIYNSWISK